MSEYGIIGPLRIPIKKGGRGNIIDSQNLQNFWRDPKADNIKAKRGCYVFGIRAAKGIVPYYVGKTSRCDFEGECFTADKLVKYMEALSETKKGSPVLFFVVHPNKRGKTNSRQIDEIETFLVKLECIKNPSHGNNQKTKREDWLIMGMTGGRKPSTSANEFKKMMGFNK